MVLEKVSDRTRPGSSSDNDVGGRYPHSYGDDANGSFYWFRFVLFTLLIVSPCLRAAYLWWAGGGRIRFRRDLDTGRITGLQIQPPMPHWFGIYHPSSSDTSTVHDRLTEEQVLALPEILFKKPIETDDLTVVNDDVDNQEVKQSEEIVDNTESDDAVVKDDSEDVDATDLVATVSDVVIRVSCGNSLTHNDCPPTPQTPRLDEEILSMSSNDDAGDSSNADQIDLPTLTVKVDQVLDEEQPSIPPVRPPIGPYTTTTCTTCSICIDEFEEGERIRLLPRCGHAFHTDCIWPWLTERQGCCPLCKSSVMEKEDDDEQEEKNGTESRPAETGDNNNLNTTSSSSSSSSENPESENAHKKGRHDFLEISCNSFFYVYYSCLIISVFFNF